MSTATMKAEKIGNLLFCPRCGTLLDLPKDGEDSVECEMKCGHVEPESSYQNLTVLTHSRPDAFPSPLRQKRKTQTKVHESGETRVVVTEECPNCGYHEAYSVNKQMRSADEGSTVLYTCVSCKFGWRLNN